MYCVSKLRREVRRALFLSLYPLASFAGDALDEVVVSATRLRDQAQIDVPASVSVLSSQTLSDSANQHFEEVLTQIPNLNWAAGSSRPRYFQIRGIGEREQYEGAPNSSVGFLIDDIDFSGIGMAATLFDVDRVEVLRGPQGTRLGANALAGIIAVQTADPQGEYNARLLAEVGDYDTRSLGVSATGPVEALDSSWRVALQKYKSDGFRSNSFLHRDDTNGRDELTARGKWRWSGDQSQLDLTLMHANLDNGYDAFSIDNTRTTLSDRPGQDSQRVTAGSAKWRYNFRDGMTATGIISALDSNSIHAYDGDWGNARSWFPFTYDYVYRADRNRSTQTYEARLASSALDSEHSIAWLVGAYHRDLNERIREISAGQFIDPDPINGYASTTDEYLSSRFASNVSAFFAQLDGRIAQRWLWSFALRNEFYSSDYRDAGNWAGDPLRFTHDDSSDSMLGGSASITFQPTNDTRVYAATSRGYKAGGFNLGSAGTLTPAFDPEYLWNFEAGIKSKEFSHALYTELIGFYMHRTHMQVRSGQQLVPGDPNSFVFVTQNVATGYNYGIEMNTHWLPISSLDLGASVGWLRTQESGSLDASGVPVPPREQAHSPSYQLQLNATYRHVSGFMARIDYAAIDAFYFDVPTDHDQRSKAYQLTNAKVGYESAQWSAYLWTRNLYDKQYATRGFYFGNEPPAWENKLYIQNGDPRTYGLSVEWKLR